MEFVTWHIDLFVSSWRVHSYVWHDHSYVFHFAYPCMLMHYIFPIPMHVYNERTYTFVIMYVYTYTCISRDRWNWWHDAFIHVYFCDACIHRCDMIIHVYFDVHDARYSFCQSCVRLYSIICVAWYFFTFLCDVVSYPYPYMRM